MVVNFETRDARQRRLDSDRQRKYVEQFRTRCAQWSAGDLELAQLCAHAGRAMDGYAVETLYEMRRSGAGDDDRAERLNGVYCGGLAQVGAAIRDEIVDSSARHAVAQTLQERLLWAEMRWYGQREFARNADFLPSRS